MMAEVTHFSEGDVLVSDARIVIGPMTYVLENVTSVRAGELPRPDGPGQTILWMALLGCGIAGLLALGNYLWLIAIPVILAVGLLLAWSLKPLRRYGVVLGSAAGEQTPLVTHDLAFVSRVVEAVNRAVVSRAEAAATASPAEPDKGAADHAAREEV